MYMKTAASWLAALSGDWRGSTTHSSDAPWPPPPIADEQAGVQPFAPVYGPVEHQHSARVASRYAPSSYQRAYDPEWRKTYNLQPPREFPFPRVAQPKGDDAFIRVPVEVPRPMQPPRPAPESIPKTKRDLLHWPPTPSIGLNYTLVEPDTTFGDMATWPDVMTEQTAYNTSDTGINMTSQVNYPRKWAWAHLKEYGLGVGFMAQIGVGTPSQRQSLILDTGTAWSWVNPQCSGTQDDNFCASNGHYTPAKSNTSKAAMAQFNYQYGSGGALGDLYRDVIRVDNTYLIPGFLLGVATYSTSLIAGVMGVAYSEKILSVVTGLATLGLIYMPVFSVGLGNHQENLGEIVFGGVNHFKYSGELQPVPVWPSFSSQTRANGGTAPDWFMWQVNLTAVGVTMPGENRTKLLWRGNEPFVVDTGSTLTYAPDPVIGNLGWEMWAIKTNENRILVNCPMMDMNGTVQFFFNGNRLRIDVKFKDFIMQQSYDDTTSCWMGAQPASVYNSSNVLGLTFMRAAYMVFDPMIESIWMANYYSCGDGVVAVGLQAGDTQDAMGQCT